MLNNQYLFFILDDETYAISANKVQEIVDYVKTTRVPNSNACVRGVTNIRGELLAVVDPVIRFGLGSIDITKRTSFIIVKINNKDKQKDVLIALMVDMVIEVEDIDESDVLPTPQFGTKIEQKYIENIIRYEDKYISLLNIGAVLNINELSQV